LVFIALKTIIRMSISINQSVNVEVISLNDTKSKAVRKPKLSAKLEKQMIFGCWFLQHLVDQSVLADAAQLSRARNELKMFENLDAQTAFYENFETNMAATQKVTRKEIADFHRPAKAPKAPKAKKDKAESEGGEVAEPKRGRKKKVVETVVDNNKDFIDQLVAVANARSAEQVAAIVSESTSNISNVEPEVTPIIATTNITQVKEKKPRKKAEPKSSETVVAAVVSAPVVAPVVVAEVVAEVASEPVKAAPKKRAAPKKKEADVVAPVVVSEPVVVAAVAVVAKAAEPVKEKAAPKKKAEPKAKVDTKAIEEAKRVAELKAVEDARQAFELEQARQAEILAAKNEADEEEEDDEKSHHTVETPESDDEDEEEEEEEIHAREFVFNGKQYLIDENTNEVYDHETQELIGTFDKESNMIIAE